MPLCDGCQDRPARWRYVLLLRDTRGIAVVWFYNGCAARLERQRT